MGLLSRTLLQFSKQNKLNINVRGMASANDIILYHYIIESITLAI